MMKIVPAIMEEVKKKNFMAGLKLQYRKSSIQSGGLMPNLTALDLSCSFRSHLG